MTRVTEFDLEEARPSHEGVLAAQDLPPADVLPARLKELLDHAFEEFDARTRPRGVAEEVSLTELEDVLDGFDGPREETVIGQVYLRGTAFALYVATLGAGLAARIRELFSANDLALAWMLDAVASSGADRLSDLLAARFEGDLIERGHASPRVLPYSPGYCGWSVRGQTKLFARLRPREIAVSLNDSCLMTPIKSVSGVLVAGDKTTHRVRPDFDFCKECKTRACGARMASVLRR